MTDADLAAYMGFECTLEHLRGFAQEKTRVGPGPLAQLRELARSRTRPVAAAPAGASADDRDEGSPPWPHASHWAKPDKTDDTYGAGAHAAALEAMAQRIEDGRVPEALLALHLAGVSAEALRAMAADPRVHATVDLHEALTKINSHADDYEALGGDEQAQHAFLGKVWAPRLHECVTEFVAVSGCGKTFTEDAQDPDGPVSKASEVRVGRMSARTRHVPDLRSLATVLAETLQRPNAGLILDPFKGSYPGDAFNVVSIPDLARQLGVQAAGGELSDVDRSKLAGFHTLNGLRCAARMKESVLAGHVAVVDRDVDEHTPEQYNAQQLPFGPWLLLVDEKILPGAAQAGYVRVPSSSARVLRHDGRVVGGGNGHVYFITEHFEDKPIIAAEAPHVAAREGVAWPKPRMSKATGKPLDSHTTTTIIDPSVFWPGRLVFEGLPHVSGRLRVGPAEVELREGPALDLGRFRRMTDADTAAFNSARVGARLERGRDGAVALQDDKLLTLDTIIEPKGHAPMTVAEWRTQFNGRKTRIQAPFRVSSSYAAFIWEESGQVRVHDSGDNTTYRLAGPRPEDAFSKVRVAPPEPEDVPPRPRPFPGAMTAIVDAMLAASPKPREGLAVMAALSGMAAACNGRVHLAEDGEMRLNAYMTVLLPTGEGKELALRVAETVAAAGGATVIGKPASGAALEERLADYVSLLMGIDEAGHLLSAMNAAHSPPYLQDLSASILQLYGRGSGVHRTRARMSGRKGPELGRDVRNPAVSALLFSTPEKFAQAVGVINVHEGQLGRHLFYIDPAPVAQRRVGKAFALPPEVAQRANEIQAAGVFKHIEESARAQNGEAAVRSVPVMYSEEAAGALQGVMDRFSSRQALASVSTLERALTARAYENTLKVAGTLAVWDNPTSPVLRTDQLAWAESLVRRSIHDVVAFAGEQMHEAGVLANAARVLHACKRVCAGELNDVARPAELALIRHGSAPRRMVLRSAHLPAQDFDKAVLHLEAVGDVRAFEAVLPADAALFAGASLRALEITAP